MTAELAIGLVSVVAVLTVVLAVGTATAAQVRCVDAAGAGARAVARGESEGTVRLLVARLAGDGARVTTSRTGDLVHVSVARAIRLPLPGRPRLLLRAAASTPVEATPVTAEP